MESRTAAPKSSSFAVDVFKLVSGTTIAQGLMVLAAPLLARLYTPEDFGALALYLSITSIVGVIACLRYELAIMLPESDEEAANLLAVSLGFSLVVTCLTTLVIGWGGETVLGWLNAPGLKPYLWLIPVTVLLDGVFQALNYWNSRTKQFGRLSIARVTSSAATVSTQLGAGYAGYATGGSLIGANVVGKTISTAVLGGQIWRDDRSTFWKAIRWRGMARGVRRYKKFPLCSTFADLLNTLSSQLPIFMFYVFFSDLIVGYFSFGLRIIQMPLGVVGLSIGQVFFQHASKSKLDGTLDSLVRKSFTSLVMIGLFPILLVTIIGYDIFVVFFGENWGEAGIYLQILGVWVFFWFIASPISCLYSVLEMQSFGLWVNFLLFLTRLISLSLGGYFGNVHFSLLLYSITGIMVYCYSNLTLMMNSGLSLRNILGILYIGILMFYPYLIFILMMKILFCMKSIPLLIMSLFLSLIYIKSAYGFFSK